MGDREREEQTDTLRLGGLSLTEMKAKDVFTGAEAALAGHAGRTGAGAEVTLFAGTSDLRDDVRTLRGPGGVEVTLTKRDGKLLGVGAPREGEVEVDRRQQRAGFSMGSGTAVGGGLYLGVGVEVSRTPGG